MRDEKRAEIERKIEEANKFITALEFAIYDLTNTSLEFSNEQASALAILLAEWVTKQKTATNELETHRRQREEKRREGFSY